MLQNLRNVGKTWLGKAVVGVLFALLIVSFAVWGIGDIFRGGASATVARVGETRIEAQAVRDAYTRQLRQLSARLGQVITPAQAQLFGLDRQVLSQLVTEAVLDERARAYGLSVGETLVARSIMEDPSFQANGQFDRNAFQRYLSLVGVSEQGFVADQRRAVARGQVIDAVVGGLVAPIAAQEAIHRFGAERRAAEVAILDESRAGAIADPDEAALLAFFQERRGQWRAPEYRAADVLAVAPETIADPAAITPEAARAYYERVKEGRFGAPERRTVERIVFPTLDEAVAARGRLASGEIDFAGLAAERAVPPDALALGPLARSEFVDQPVAEAAFALPEGGVSEPVAGRFGSTLVRVVAVEPARIRPFEEVEAEVRGELALEQARERIRFVYDEIEDQRASARPLAEIARERGLALIRIPAVDRQGLDQAARPVEVPERQSVARAIFESDVGVDNLALRTDAGGYVWFDVTAVEPARDRELDEVRAEVLAAWRADATGTRLEEIAAAALERLRAGEALAAVAGELGAAVQPVAGLARGQPSAGLDAQALARVFATPVGEAGSAPLGETRRVLFRVTQAQVPPFVTTTPQAEQIEARASAEIAQDLLDQYLAAVQAQIGVEVDEAAFRAAIGGGDV